MKKTNPKSKKDLFAKIDLGVRLGVAHALAEHKRMGQSIVVWRNGKIVTIPPEKIKIQKKILNSKF